MSTVDDSVPSGPPGKSGPDTVDSLLTDLRDLRIAAGAPSYRALAGRAGIARSTAYDALRGQTLPSLEITTAIAVALGGDQDAWTRRWRAARRALDTPDDLAGTDETDEVDVTDEAGEPAEPTITSVGRPADRAEDTAPPGQDKPDRRRRRWWYLVPAAAALVVGGVAVGVALAGADDPSCTHASVYGVTGDGRVLDAQSHEIARIGTGDTVTVLSTDHDAFPHRYRARTPGGVVGYVDEAKLDFRRDVCV